MNAKDIDLISMCGLCRNAVWKPYLPAMTSRLSGLMFFSLLYRRFSNIA